MNIWKKYKKLKLISSGRNSELYEAKNIEKGNYVAIKKIIKKNLKNGNKTKFEYLMSKIKNENFISFKEIIETEEYFYIIMELCECNLEEYINRREDKITINEIKEVLIQLNNILKILNNKKKIKWIFKTK